MTLNTCNDWKCQIGCRKILQENEQTCLMCGGATAVSGGVITKASRRWFAPLNLTDLQWAAAARYLAALADPAKHSPPLKDGWRPRNRDSDRAMVWICCAKADWPATQTQLQNLPSNYALIKGNQDYLRTWGVTCAHRLNVYKALIPAGVGEQAVVRSAIPSLISVVNDFDHNQLVSFHDGETAGNAWGIHLSNEERYLVPTALEFTLGHETGHAIDQTIMGQGTDMQPVRRWVTGFNQPNTVAGTCNGLQWHMEYFADAFSAVMMRLGGKLKQPILVAAGRALQGSLQDEFHPGNRDRLRQIESVIDRIYDFINVH